MKGPTVLGKEKLTWKGKLKDIAQKYLNIKDKGNIF